MAPLKIGLTGGIAAGKSEALKAFARLGAATLSSDAVVHEMLESDELRRVLVERWGPEVAPDGKIERGKIGEIVFADPEQLSWLEEQIHPLVRERTAAWLMSLPADTEVAVVEVPLLFEKALENWFDFTICVACAPALQLARLEQRGLPRTLASQRISKQLPLARKIELSDFVLWNEGTAEFLEAQVDRLIPALASR